MFGLNTWWVGGCHISIILRLQSHAHLLTPTPTPTSTPLMQNKRSREGPMDDKGDEQELASSTDDNGHKQVLECKTVNKVTGKKSMDPSNEP